jgi:hypothetical protein
VNFVRSLPLFVAAAAFFVAGGLVLEFDPHVGPGVFTLWALLLALGFVSAIGGVASWLLVGDGSRSPTASRPSPSPSPSPSPAPASSLRAAGNPTPRARAEFGRPPPAASPPREIPPYRPIPSDLDPTVLASTAEWDEEGAVEEFPYPADTLVDSSSVEDVLRDLDGIEHDLAPRSRPPPRRSLSS